MIFILFIIIGIILFHASILYKNRLLSTEASRQGGSEKLLIKPEITAFLFYGFIKSFFATIVILPIFYSGINLGIKYFIIDVSTAESHLIPIAYLWLSISIILALSYLLLSIKYKKEKYIFYSDKLIHRGGGIFSDFERELIVKNITHVTMKLPFIETNLFGTGYIRIESAGAITTEIFLRAINKPKEIYENIINIMKNNGFKLSRKTLVEREKPHNLAVFFEVFGLFMMAIFVLSVIVGNITVEFDIVKIIWQYALLFTIGIGLVIAGILTFCVFHFLDLKRRIYDLYEDTITYSEGFLDKNYSFIPIENLADSAVTQSIISKLFGLYDVKVSCQGSGQEVLFKNMANGETLSNNIDKLISRTKSLVEGVAEKEIISEEKLTPEIPVRRKLEPDRSYTGEFRMDPLRTWLPVIICSPLLIILFPAGIIAVVNNIISIACNIFRIKTDTIEHTFSFLSRKTKEFSLDKITGIVIKENFVDKWRKTFSILFWSIGAGENITFSNVKKEKGLQEKILSKKGIQPQNILYKLNSEYTIPDMIKGNLYMNIIFASLAITSFVFFQFYGWLSLLLLILIFATIVIYRKIYYKNSQIFFYEDYIHFKRGLFFKENYFVFYDDVKDIATVKYPLSSRGNIKFNVAGELVYKTRQGQRVISNSFTIRFVKNIKVLDELIDTIFYSRPSLKKIKEIEKNLQDTSLQPTYSTKPCLSNYLLFVLPGLLIIDIGIIVTVSWFSLKTLSLLTYVVLLLSIIAISAVIITIKAISYNTQPYRVYARSGVIFKKQISVVFNKIDFINFTQGPINKLFSNGNITINTTGSSKSELIIRNIKDFKNLYENLKKNYR